MLSKTILTVEASVYFWSTASNLNQVASLLQAQANLGSNLCWGVNQQDVQPIGLCNLQLLLLFSTYLPDSSKDNYSASNFITVIVGRLSILRVSLSQLMDVFAKYMHFASDLTPQISEDIFVLIFHLNFVIIMCDYLVI